MPITDAAVENGVYLRPLKDEEATAVISAVLLEQALKEGRFEDAREIADILITRFANFAYAHVKRAEAVYGLFAQEFIERFETPEHIPDALMERAVVLQGTYRRSFAHAVELGWRPTDGVEGVE